MSQDTNKVLQRSHEEYVGSSGVGIGITPVRNPILFLEMSAMRNERDQEW